jgi:hypothetical protein
MPLDFTDSEPRPPFHNAKWCTHEGDDGAVRLQIELGRDYAVLLSCRPDEPPSVTLWYGGGERDFNSTAPGRGFTPDSFRKWIEEVLAA